MTHSIETVTGIEEFSFLLWIWTQKVSMYKVINKHLWCNDEENRIAICIYAKDFESLAMYDILGGLFKVCNIFYLAKVQS